MKTDQEILSSFLKTTQMGQVGIRCLMNRPLHPQLKAALARQLEEYDALERRGSALCRQRGWQAKPPDPGARLMADMMTRLQLGFGNSDSRAAAMMIRGNMRGVIKGIKNLNHRKGSDPQVEALSRSLIQTEENNIRAMQGFL